MSSKIAVIILDYNGGEIVNKCIESFKRLTVLPDQILFIDNGSVHYSEYAIREKFGHEFSHRLRCIRNSENQGYAKGFNLGLQVTLAEKSADWIMTLNNDTELEPDFFKKLYSRLSKLDSSIGMLGPKLRSSIRPEYLDGVGLVLSLDGMCTARGQFEKDCGQYDKSDNVFAPNGVAAIYKAKMLREIGLFDESFGSYCEDVDLGLRAWNAGWECEMLSECIVYHYRSSTSGQYSLVKLYLVERNHYWVVLKNFPIILILLNPIFTLYRLIVQLYAVIKQKGQGRGFTAKNARFSLLEVSVRAICDAWRGFPRALKERRNQSHLLKRPLVNRIFFLWQKRIQFNELILK